MAHVNDIKVSSDEECTLYSNRSPEEPTYKPSGGLSAREMDVLVWLARGKSGMEVAEILGISLCTVRVHIRNMIRKLNVSNIPHAVARAFEMGILTSQMSN